MLDKTVHLRAAKAFAEDDKNSKDFPLTSHAHIRGLIMLYERLCEENQKQAEELAKYRKVAVITEQESGGSLMEVEDDMWSLPAGTELFVKV